jgi:ABC-type glycerol-3-phosphate transport system permease component
MMLSRRWSTAGNAILALAVLITLLPFVYTFVNSIKYIKDIVTNALVFTPTLENYVTLFFSKQSAFMDNTMHSFIIAVCSTVLVVVISSLAAFSLERFHWPRHLAGILAMWILLFHMIPAVTLVGPFYTLFRSVGLYDTLAGMILAHLVLNLPLGIWISQSFIAELPKELEEAARIDGCSNIGTFLRIVVPLVAPGLAAVAILTFVFSWNEFLFALNLTSTNASTIPVGIAKFAQQYEIRYGEMSAAAFFATIPAIIFLAIAQRQIVKGLTLGALK